MIRRGDGYLLSTASAAGLLTQVSALAYSATKHAAVAVAEWLAITYGDAGVKVSCLCPQAVRTPMLDTALEDRCRPAAGRWPARARRGGGCHGRRPPRGALSDPPHEDVAHHMALKGAQPERWLKGMRRIVREARPNPTA